MTKWERLGAASGGRRRRQRRKTQSSSKYHVPQVKKKKKGRWVEAGGWCGRSLASHRVPQGLAIGVYVLIVSQLAGNVDLNCTSLWTWARQNDMRWADDSVQLDSARARQAHGDKFASLACKCILGVLGWPHRPANLAFSSAWMEDAVPSSIVWLKQKGRDSCFSFFEKKWRWNFISKDFVISKTQQH